MIECKKDTCKQRYIGQSGQKFASRIAQHRGYIQNRKFNQPTGYHFNQPGHSVSDMSVTILEKVKYRDELYRREREKYLINKFDTYKNGMNKQPWGHSIFIVNFKVVIKYIINDRIFHLLKRINKIKVYFQGMMALK